MLIDPKRLALLLSVHREGGIIAAADVLGISASAVSQQMKKLEDEVGLAIIERSAHGSILTPAGMVLIHTAEKIESELSDASRALAPLTGTVTGHVGIASFQTLLMTILVPFLGDLTKDAPGIELTLTETDETGGMADLRAGRIELLALERDATPPPPPRGYTDTPLLDEPWVLVTPSHIPTITSENELSSLTWLRTPRGLAGTKATERITAALPASQWSTHTYYNYGAALSMVAAGLGSTVLPSLAISDPLPEGVAVTPLPTLGVRRILLRHRTKDSGPETPLGQVLERLQRWVSDNPRHWGIPLTAH